MAWTKQRWVVGGVIVVVGVALLFSERGRQAITSEDPATSPTSVTSPARPCTVKITADVLSALSRPDGNARVVDTYRKGEVVSADRTTRNGFRQLTPGRWVAQEYAEPTPGSDCG